MVYINKFECVVSYMLLFGTFRAQGQIKIHELKKCLRVTMVGCQSLSQMLHTLSGLLSGKAGDIKNKCD